MKKFKTKSHKKNKRKNIVIVLIMVLLIILFIYISSKTLTTSYPKFVNALLNEQGIIKDNDASFFSLWTSNLDLLLNNYYFKDQKSNSSLVYQEVLPLVYIYASHDEEEYNYKNNVLGIKNDIYSIGNLLKSNLLEYNIESVFEEKRVSTYLEKENLNYSESYKVSRRFLEDSIINYPTLNYFIDIHRDSVNGDITNVTINNKPYAKIMFVLGLDNPSYLENKKLMIKMNDYLNKYYPNLSRGIYEKQGSGVNGVYNQDFHKNTILIEIGGVDNNLESVVNSTEIIAKALYYIIGEENEKGS